MLRSRSVAVSCRTWPAVWMRMLLKIGIVLLRSIAPWSWVISSSRSCLLTTNSAASSAVAPVAPVLDVGSTLTFDCVAVSCIALKRPLRMAFLSRKIQYCIGILKTELSTGAGGTGAKTQTEAALVISGSCSAVERLFVFSDASQQTSSFYGDSTCQQLLPLTFAIPDEDQARGNESSANPLRYRKQR